jgi:hypothetical protein
MEIFGAELPVGESEYECTREADLSSTPAGTGDTRATSDESPMLSSTTLHASQNTHDLADPR